MAVVPSAAGAGAAAGGAGGGAGAATDGGDAAGAGWAGASAGAAGGMGWEGSAGFTPGRDHGVERVCQAGKLGALTKPGWCGRVWDALSC